MLKISNNPLDMLFKMINKNYPELEDMIYEIVFDLKLNDLLYQICANDDETLFKIYVNTTDVDGNYFSIEDVVYILMKCFAHIISKNNESSSVVNKVLDDLIDEYQIYLNTSLEEDQLSIDELSDSKIQ